MLRRTDVTSYCMQFEKWGHGLLRKAFWSEGELAESVGEGERRVSVLEHGGEHCSASSK